MTEYRSVTVSHGSGGYGGPLTITPTEAKHKLVYICLLYTSPSPRD